MSRPSNKSNWSRALLRWEEYSSPFRLSPEDIENYSLVLKRLEKKERILLLGSTPEIREVLSKLNLHVIVADFSFQMISGMLSFGQIDEYKEKWTRADWMDLDKFLKNGYFDVILGDLVLRNIEPSLQQKFLKTISNLLTPRGYFVSRIHYINQDFLDMGGSQIIKRGLEEKGAEDIIAGRLFDKYTDFKTQKIDKQKFQNIVKRYLLKSCFSKKEKLILNNILKKWTPPKNLSQRTWTQRTPKEIDELLLRYFIIRDMKIAHDYKDSEFYPIYILKNKKNDD